MDEVDSKLVVNIVLYSTVLHKPIVNRKSLLSKSALYEFHFAWWVGHLSSTEVRLTCAVDLWRSVIVGWLWKPGIRLGDVIKAMAIPNHMSASLVGAVDMQNNIHCRRR